MHVLLIFSIFLVQYIILYCIAKVKLQWPPAFKSQTADYQSNKKLMHHYQLSKNQLNL